MMEFRNILLFILVLGGLGSLLTVNRHLFYTGLHVESKESLSANVIVWVIASILLLLLFLRYSVKMQGMQNILLSSPAFASSLWVVLYTLAASLFYLVFSHPSFYWNLTWGVIGVAVFVHAMFQNPFPKSSSSSSSSSAESQKYAWQQSNASKCKWSTLLICSVFLILLGLSRFPDAISHALLPWIIVFLFPILLYFLSIQFLTPSSSSSSASNSASSSAFSINQVLPILLFFATAFGLWLLRDRWIESFPKEIGVLTLLAVFLVFATYCYFTFAIPGSQSQSHARFSTQIFPILMVGITLIGLFLLRDHWIHQSPKTIGILVLLFLFVLFAVYCYFTQQTPPQQQQQSQPSTTSFHTFHRAWVAFLGITSSIGFIGWLATFISSSHGTAKWIYTSIVILISLVFLVQLVVASVTTAASKSSKSTQLAIRLLQETILYVPCVIQSTGQSLFAKTGTTPLAVWVWFGVSVAAWVLLWRYQRGIHVRGRSQWISQPLPLEKESVLDATYDDLMGTTTKEGEQVDKQYRFGLSAWIFTDTVLPNLKPSVQQWANVFHWGSRIRVEYQASSHTLRVVMPPSPFSPKDGKDGKDEPKSSLVLYEFQGWKSQRWNYLVLQFEGGTLDIFLNGELLHSVDHAIPYQQKDGFVAGEERGIQGEIANVAFFRQPLTLAQIVYEYELLRTQTPPVFDWIRRV